MAGRGRGQRLVVIAGPIASGKSTLAAELADRLRGAGDSVAVVGLDSVAEMALPSLADWSWAHEVHGQVIAAWLATPILTVIAEGPETPGEVEQVLRHVPGSVRVLRVLLVTTYEVALARVTADQSRGVSRDPAFLRGMYRRFEAELPQLAYDLRLDGAAGSPEALGARVVAALDEAARIGR